MEEVIDKIFADSKGILAADESTGTIEKRFKSVGMPCNEGLRNDYRYTLFSTPGLENFIGGVILYEETLQNEETIAPLKEKNIVLGIKVDKGVQPYNREGGQLTAGLDGLGDRLRDYKHLGAKFAKWRAVLSVKDTDNCILANAWTLARYAKQCQMEDIVPIIEPEVIMDGTHSIYDSFEVTAKALHMLFDALYWEKVSLEHIILKPNMIVSGYDAPKRESVEEVAKATLNCFNRGVPAAVPVIAFLSGGQEDKEALDNLAQMNTEHYLPWALSFSFGRTLQGGALQRWSSHLQRWSNSCCSQVSGSPEDWLLYRAQQCSEAVQGIFIVGEDS